MALGLFLVVTALTEGALLRVTARVLAALDQVARDEESLHRGFVLGALAREEYLHQAHIILNEDDSHLGHYRETVSAFEQAAGGVAASLESAAERAQLTTILSVNRRIHQRLEEEIRPALAQKDRARVRQLHEATEAEVDRIVSLAGELSNSFQRRIDASIYRAHAVSSQAHQRAISVPLVLLLLALAAGVWIGRQQERRVLTEKLSGLSRVAAGVAHELNNPLGVILGYVRVVMRQPLAPALAEAIQIIDDEARQCQRIVEGLRDHVRPLVLERKLVDLHAMLLDTIARSHDSASRIRIDLDARATEGLWVYGDTLRLRQVFVNLLRNAIEASPPQEAITVRAVRDGAWVQVAMIDQGGGIAPEHRARLFEPFFTTKDHGTGLGLSICAAIVRAHGGEITVESNPPAGTTVLVRLPTAGAGGDDA